MKTVGKGEYYDLRDGEWIEIEDSNGFYQKCCDCGLYHFWVVRVRNGKIQLRAERVSQDKAESINRHIALKQEDEQRDEVDPLTFRKAELANYEFTEETLFGPKWRPE